MNETQKLLQMQLMADYAILQNNKCCKNTKVYCPACKEEAKKVLEIIAELLNFDLEKRSEEVNEMDKLIRIKIISGNTISKNSKCCKNPRESCESCEKKAADAISAIIEFLKK